MRRKEFFKILNLKPDLRRTPEKNRSSGMKKNITEKIIGNHEIQNS
jgi:hypothetical protein